MISVLSLSGVVEYRRGFEKEDAIRLILLVDPWATFDPPLSLWRLGPNFAQEPLRCGRFENFNFASPKEAVFGPFGRFEGGIDLDNFHVDDCNCVGRPQNSRSQHDQAEQSD